MPVEPPVASSADPQLDGQTVSTKRRRQNPVSCHFCREKKLKCDRQSPCSNCSFRGLVCSSEFTSQPQNRSALSDNADNVVVLERLRRLEEIVLNQQRHPTSGGNRPQSTLTSAPVSAAGPWQSTSSTPAASLVQDVPDRHRATDCHKTPVSEYAHAVRTLEGTGLQRDPWLRTDTVNIAVRVASAKQIALLTSDPTLRELLLHKPTICCTLPPKEEAVLLLDYYKDHLEDLQHVLHIPTVQQHLNTFYTNLARGQPVNGTVLALLLSIFASASVVISLHSGSTASPFSQFDGAHLSAYWAEIALNMMKDRHNTSCDMLEDLQATIILGNLLLNIEGFSARVHSFFTITVSKARDLSLHKIDSAGSWAPRDSIDTEVRRRVWWYLVTIDWVLSACGGPQEGTYSIQPRQMAVNIPRNIDDKDLIYTDPPINRPLSEATVMSYDIQRIKLGDLCREVVDLIPISVGDITTVDYQQVMALDQRFDAFLQQLPVFLRNDEQSIRQSERVMAQYPQMRTQRQLLSMSAKAKRCKMHQPFVIRGSRDTRYSYSRTMSLKSARAVLEDKRRSDALNINSHLHHRYKLSAYMTYHTFMATIVLVMDLCFNQKSPSDGEDDEETRVTKAEVMEACRSLHQDQSTPGMGVTYLASLMDVLRKHKVKLRPGGGEFNTNNAAFHPTYTNNIPHQRPALPGRLPPSVFANSPQNMTQLASFPGAPLPPPHWPIMMSSDSNINTSTTNTELGLNVNLNQRSNSNNFSLGDHGTTRSTGPADPDPQDCLADFDDIWNDYVELGSNFDTPHWDSLFSDLGPGMA